VGPDLLDPLLHEAATGRASYNLDGWMLTKAYNLACVRRLAGDADVAVVEGAEGLFDGGGGDGDGDERGSTGQIAKWLGAPVVLILDCASLRARSAAAVLKGYLAFDGDLDIAGVVLNKTEGATHARLVTEAIEAARLGVPVFGAVHRDESIAVVKDSGSHGALGRDYRGHGGHRAHAHTTVAPTAFAAAAAKAAAALHAGGGNSIGGVAAAAAEERDGGGGNGGDGGDGMGGGRGGRGGGGTFVTGVAAQLAHVVAAHVDLHELIAAAVEFAPDAAAVGVEEVEGAGGSTWNGSADSSMGARGGSGASTSESSDEGVQPADDGGGEGGDRGGAVAAKVVADKGNTSAGETPDAQSNRSLSIESSTNGDVGGGGGGGGGSGDSGGKAGVPLSPSRSQPVHNSFGGKDLNQFPAIPESPTSNKGLCPQP
jgi:hypothetical protein